MDARRGSGADGTAGASRIANVSGAVLLGGRSTRMGRDKARLVWRGEALAVRAARLLDALFEETLLVGGTPPEQAPGRRVADPEGPACALRGLVGALEAAQGERVLVIATDLPLLPLDLLLALLAWPERDVVVPKDERGDHPLCAIYRPEACLARARAHLEGGRLAISALLDAVDTERVSLATLGLEDLAARALANVNTPEDLARLEVA
ncbi:MAG: molybdenum cofactor guanylyltransferase [Myxococcota bacterium]